MFDVGFLYNVHRMFAAMRSRSHYNAILWSVAPDLDICAAKITQSDSRAPSWLGIITNIRQEESSHSSPGIILEFTLPQNPVLVFQARFYRTLLVPLIDHLQATPFQLGRRLVSATKP